MRGTLQLSKVLGIPVQVHWTFGLVILWIIYMVYEREGSFNWYLFLGISAFMMSLFFCVILHEFGHALTAKKYGITTLDIIISPIGGVARLSRMPEKPLQEFWVAIAGPIVNLVIIIILVFIFYMVSTPEKFYQLRFLPQQILYPDSNFFPVSFNWADYFILGIIGVNAILAIFNLVPAFPLDGGRIFRAILSIKFGRYKATRIAVGIGKIFAVGLIIYGFMNIDIVLSFIGLFILLTGHNEMKMVFWERSLAEKEVIDLARMDLPTINEADSIKETLEKIGTGQEAWLIDINNEPIELLKKEKLVDLKDNAPQSLIGIGKPIKDWSLVDGHVSLKEVYQKIKSEHLEGVLVVQNNEIRGILEEFQIEAFLDNLKEESFFRLF